MKHKLKYVVHLMFLVLMLACMSAQTASAAAKPPTNGWYTAADGHKYYYKNGKMLKGWQKISGYWYRFNGTGLMNTNCIVPSKDGLGWRYVGHDGIYCTDKAVQRAVNMVMAHSDPAKSNGKRIGEVYRYMKSKARYAYNSKKMSTAVIPEMANIYMTQLKGDCITTTCGFAYIPLVLRFNVRIQSGTCGSKTNPHTWPEIYCTDYWYIFDLSREYHPIYGKYGWYKIKAGKSYDVLYRPEKTYTVQVKKGQVVWTESKAK
ncbi:MAG: hypothetical protein KBT01_01815 [Clostridiales bacterium]|nr:hypothetical protein [Candidatus Blautia equi]